MTAASVHASNSDDRVRGTPHTLYFSGLFLKKYVLVSLSLSSMPHPPQPLANTRVVKLFSVRPEGAPFICRRCRCRKRLKKILLVLCARLTRQLAGTRYYYLPYECEHYNEKSSSIGEHRVALRCALKITYYAQ